MRISNPTIVRSIRLTPSEDALISEYAARHDLNRHLAMRKLTIEGIAPVRAS